MPTPHLRHIISHTLRVSNAVTAFRAEYHAPSVSRTVDIGARHQYPRGTCSLRIDTEIPAKPHMLDTDLRDVARPR